MGLIASMGWNLMWICFLINAFNCIPQPRALSQPLTSSHPWQPWRCAALTSLHLLLSFLKALLGVSLLAQCLQYLPAPLRGHGLPKQPSANNWVPWRLGPGHSHSVEGSSHRPLCSWNPHWLSQAWSGLMHLRPPRPILLSPPSLSLSRHQICITTSRFPLPNPVSYLPVLHSSYPPTHKETQCTPGSYHCLLPICTTLPVLFC